MKLKLVLVMLTIPCLLSGCADKKSDHINTNSDKSLSPEVFVPFVPKLAPKSPASDDVKTEVLQQNPDLSEEENNNTGVEEEFIQKDVATPKSEDNLENFEKINEYVEINESQNPETSVIKELVKNLFSGTFMTELSKTPLKEMESVANDLKKWECILKNDESFEAIATYIERNEKNKSAVISEIKKAWSETFKTNDDLIDPRKTLLMNLLCRHILNLKDVVTSAGRQNITRFFKESLIDLSNKEDPGPYQALLNTLLFLQCAKTKIFDKDGNLIAVPIISVLADGKTVVITLPTGQKELVKQVVDEMYLSTNPCWKKRVSTHDAVFDEQGIAEEKKLTPLQGGLKIFKRAFSSDVYYERGANFSIKNGENSFSCHFLINLVFGENGEAAAIFKIEPCGPGETNALGCGHGISGKASKLNAVGGLKEKSPYADRNAVLVDGSAMDLISFKNTLNSFKKYFKDASNEKKSEILGKLLGLTMDKDNLVNFLNSFVITDNKEQEGFIDKKLDIEFLDDETVNPKQFVDSSREPGVSRQKRIDEITIPGIQFYMCKKNLLKGQLQDTYGYIICDMAKFFDWYKSKGNVSYLDVKKIIENQGKLYYGLSNKRGKYSDYSYLKATNGLFAEVFTKALLNCNKKDVIKECEREKHDHRIFPNGSEKIIFKSKSCDYVNEYFSLDNLRKNLKDMGIEINFKLQ